MEMTPMSTTGGGCFDVAGALGEVFQLKVGTGRGTGWSPRLRQRFGYFTPDEWYEAIMFRLIKGDTDWLDVGCGKSVFPHNTPLGHVLSTRCRLLVGIDPDDSVYENRLLHESVRCTLDEYDTKRQFDVISFRMVAEHIGDPIAAVAKLNHLTRLGGDVVVYTVSKWSPASMVAALTPMAIHHAAKKTLWGALKEDSFPTLYKMNTRTELRRLFAAAGFAEDAFFYLNDCRSLARWRITSFLELAVERCCRALHVRYPEICLLGIYRKEK